MEQTDRESWTLKLVRLFLDNTALSLLTLLTLIFGGWFAFSQLQVGGFPEVPVSFAIISTVLPGGTSSDVETQVTTPLEAAVKNIGEVKEVSSVSQPNISIITVSFNEGAATAGPLAELRGKVQSVKLPETAQKPDVTVPTVSAPAYTVAVLKPGASTSELAAAGRKLTEALLARKEIASVEALYPLKDRVLVQVDLAKLQASGVTLGQLLQVLPGVAINYPAGQATLDGRVQPLVVEGQLNRLDELMDSVVGTRPGAVPVPVRLREVAEVQPEATSSGKVERALAADQGQATAGAAYLYGVRLRSGQSLLKADPALQAYFQEIDQTGQLGSGIKLRVVDNQAEQARIQVKEILGGAIGEKWQGPTGYLGYLFGGIWLLLLALLLFVNYRVAIIGALAIPLSFLFTFIALLLLGVQLNTIVLFSFILVLGLIVDPAIVVLESMQRYHDLGHTGRGAALLAVKTIGEGLFLAVLTSVIVFLPFGMVSGILGEIIKFIPLTVVPALIASFFVPLVLLTWLASKFLTGGHHADKEEHEHLWPFAKWLIRANAWILERRLVQVFIIVAALVIPLGVTGWLFSSGRVYQVQFSQAADVTSLQVRATFDRSRTEAEKGQIAERLERVLAEQPEVKAAYINDQQPTGLSWIVYLTEAKERTRTSKQIMATLQSEVLSDQLAIFTFHPMGVGTPQSEFPIKLQIFDSDLDKLRAAAIETGRVARQTAGVAEVDDGFTDVREPETHIVLDRSKLQKSGLNPFLVGQQIQAIYGEQLIGQVYDPGRQETVDFVLTGAESSKKLSVDELKDISLSRPTGGPTLPLHDIATIEERPAQATIGHVNGRRFVQVRAKVTDEKEALALQKKIHDSWTPDKLVQYGLSKDALENRGEFDDITRSFSQLGQALLAAILLTYIVLVLFFRSFSQPLIILFSVPLTFIGVFPALALVGGQLGFLETLGIVTLVGIVENVGIFLIDLANRYVRQGMKSKEAVAQAAGIRFRPIFLTKVTAAGGLLPLAILSPFWRGLAVVVIAGILVSGILSLFTTPILYSWFSHRWRLPRRRRSRVAVAE